MQFWVIEKVVNISYTSSLELLLVVSGDDDIVDLSQVRAV